MEKAAMPQATSACKPLTTFVHTDTNSFREVVQRLTGPPEPNPTEPSPQAPKPMGPRKPKLHERRQYMRPKLEIVKPSSLSFRPNSEQSSPSSSKSLKASPLATPSSIMSKLTLQEEAHKRGEAMALSLEEALANLSNQEEEEKAIKERRFYLHPSPRERMGYTSEPELLALFPLESPNNN